MFFVIGNVSGMIIAAIPVLVACGVGEIHGSYDMKFMMVVTEPLLFAMDIGYRLITKDGHDFDPNRGGSIFILPVWVYGVLFFAFGVVYYARD